MLLANLAKSDSLSRLLTLKRPAISSLSSATTALDQLLDLFNAGVHGKFNPSATYEYLVYVFADLAKVLFLPLLPKESSADLCW